MVLQTSLLYGRRQFGSDIPDMPLPANTNKDRRAYGELKGQLRAQAEQDLLYVCAHREFVGFVCEKSRHIRDDLKKLSVVVNDEQVRLHRDECRQQDMHQMANVIATIGEDCWREAPARVLGLLLEFETRGGRATSLVEVF